MPARQYKTALKPRKQIHLAYPSWLPKIKSLRAILVTFVIAGVLSFGGNSVASIADAQGFERGQQAGMMTAHEIASQNTPYIVSVHGGHGKGYVIKWSNGIKKHTPSLRQFLAVCHQNKDVRDFCKGSYVMANTWMGFMKVTLHHKNMHIKRLQKKLAAQ
jgi:hypothetical protein